MNNEPFIEHIYDVYTYLWNVIIKCVRVGNQLQESKSRIFIWQNKLLDVNITKSMWSTFKKNKADLFIKNSVSLKKYRI